MCLKRKIRRRTTIAATKNLLNFLMHPLYCYYFAYFKPKLPSRDAFLLKIH